MAYYRVCPKCGGNIDPGEKCDCEKEKARQQEIFSRQLRMEPKGGQLAFAFICEDTGKGRV